MRGAPPDYFVTGGTMTLSASSYIERVADHELFSELLERRYCYVLDARQMGKSSLAVRTIAKLRAHNVRCVSIDLTRIGGNNTTPDQWYAGLCREVGRATGLERDVPRHWTERQSVSPMQRFFEFLHDVLLPASADPVVVFIDETDALLSLPFSADELLAGIREAFNRRAHDAEYGRLTFCLLGVAVPTDLIRDPRTTPFNVGTRVELCDFTLRELGKYAEVLGANGGRLIERVHFWTNGHPYLTQSLCQALSRKPELQKANDVDALVRTLFLAPESRQVETTIADVASRALHAGDVEPWPDRFRADLLSAYESILKRKRVPDDDSNRVIALLKLSGLTRSEGQTLRARNRIYARVFDREWVRENMPGQELRRQRRAFALGALRAGGVGFVFTAVVGALALRNASLVRVAQASAKRAREAQTQSDLFSYRAYMLTLANATEAFDKGNYRNALKVLDELENQPQGGWELAYTQKRFHRVGRFVNAHRDRIYSMEFLPDGRLFSLSIDGTLALWDASTGRLVRRYSMPKVSMLGGAYPDGRHLALVDFKGNLCEFDLDRGQIVWQRHVGAPKPGSIHVSPDGQRILVVADPRGAATLVCSAANGEVVRSFSVSEDAAQCGAWSPDGRRVVLSYEDPKHDQKTMMLDVRSGRQLWRHVRNGDPTVALSFSPNGSRLVGMRAIGKGVFIDPQTGQEGAARTFHDVWPYGLSPLPGHRGWVTAALDSKIKFWNDDLSRLVGERDLHTPIWLSAVDPSGRFAATTGVDGEIYIWNVPTQVDDPSAHGPVWQAFPGRFVQRLAMTPDKSSIVVCLSPRASGVPSYALLCLRVADRRVLWQESTDRAVYGIGFSPDSRTFAASSVGGTQVDIRRTGDGSLVRRIPGASAAFSPDGSRIAIGNLGSKGFQPGWVSTLATPSWEPIARASAIYGSIATLDFSPDGAKLAVGGADLSVGVLDSTRLRGLFTLRGHNNEVRCVRYDPSGAKLFSSGFDMNIREWDADSGAAEAVMLNSDANGTAQDILFLGSHRMALGRGGEFQVWDVQNARRLLSLRIEKGSGGIATMPNGDILAAEGGDLVRLEQ